MTTSPELAHHHQTTRQSDYRQDFAGASWIEHCECGAERYVERDRHGTVPTEWVELAEKTAG